MEVEEMISKLREQQGRPFDMKQLITACMSNVIMNMLFGHRFDHSDPTFQQFLHKLEDNFATFSPVLEIFPALRFFPYFKNRFATHLRTAQDMYSFINTGISACIEVCYCFLTRNDVSVYSTMCRLSVVSNGCIAAKRCEIELRLLLITNTGWRYINVPKFA